MCQSKTRPAGIGKVTATTAADRSPGTGHIVRPATQDGSLRPWARPGPSVASGPERQPREAVPEPGVGGAHPERGPARPWPSCADLGQDMLEIGPGPGAATEWLRHQVGRLTAVEVDAAAARQLADRYAARQRQRDHRRRDRAELPGRVLRLGRARSPCCTTCPRWPLQNKILAEAFRVLRPGGVLSARTAWPATTCTTSTRTTPTTRSTRPALLSRLQTLGFERITIMVDDRREVRGAQAAGQHGCAAGTGDRAA